MIHSNVADFHLRFLEGDSLLPLLLLSSLCFLLDESSFNDTSFFISMDEVVFLVDPPLSLLLLDFSRDILGKLGKCRLLDRGLRQNSSSFSDSWTITSVLDADLGLRSTIPRLASSSLRVLVRIDDVSSHTIVDLSLRIKRTMQLGASGQGRRSYSVWPYKGSGVRIVPWH